MDLKYYNLACNETMDYYNKSLFEKIEWLLKNNIFEVRAENWNDFINELSLIDKLEVHSHNHDKIIASLNYLELNSGVINEISRVVISGLTDKLGTTITGIELLDEYRGGLIAAHDNVSKSKIIGRFIDRTIKEITETCDFENHIYFSANEYLTNKEKLITLVENYYESFVFTDEIGGDWLQEIKEDVITHVCPPDAEAQIVMYKSGMSFLVLNDLLNVLAFLKNEIKILNHNDVALKELQGDSNFSIQNITDNKNRFPDIFKSAYYCELFFYLFSQHPISKPIIFSYYYAIFKRNKWFNRRLKVSEYLSFINRIYGLNEVRLRKELSGKRENEHINRIIKLEKCFRSLIPD